MHRQIQPPAREVIAEGSASRAPAASAPRGRTRPSGARLRRAQHRLAQRHQPRAHPVEHRRDLGAAGAGLVIVQQRVIEVAAIAPAPPPPRAAAPPPAPASAGNGRPRRARAPRPRPLRDRGHARHLRRQPRRHAVRARHRAGSGAAWPRRPRRAPPPPPASHRCADRCAARAAPLQRRHLLGCAGGRAARHHGFLVPAQPAHHLAQRLGLALMGHQFS
jgi:hypothetical protein